jgi:hypothetical protein
MNYLLDDGRVCQIDREDVGRVAGYRWRLYASSTRSYVRARVPHPKTGRPTYILMHTLIMRPPGGMVVIHRNHDPLDMRRRFLLVVKRGTATAEHRENGSRPRGVYPTARGRYVARIRTQGKLHYLGTFATMRDAEVAYDRAAHANRGKYARTNSKIRHEYGLDQYRRPHPSLAGPAWAEFQAERAVNK